MIRVLVVEDEPVAAAAHAEYVGRVSGFVVVGTARTAADAVRLLREPGEVDLVLLDMHLPDRHGLEVVRAMRAAGHPADVLAVTSARDLAVVRAAVSQGIVQYLLKPFAFAALRERLEQYSRYREQLQGSGERAASQEEVDRTLAALRAAPQATLPKGVSATTLEAVVGRLEDGAASAQEVADHLGTSRVTARRYLEHLCDRGSAERRPRYGGTGRPELEYRLI